MKIVSFRPEQAFQFSELLAPWVLGDPDRDALWYLGASDEERGLIAMAAVDPLTDGAVLKSIAVRPSAQHSGVGQALVLGITRLLRQHSCPSLSVLWETDRISWQTMAPFLEHCGLAHISSCPVYLAPVKEMLKLPLHIRMSARKRRNELRSLAWMMEPDQAFLLRQLKLSSGLTQEDLSEADPLCSWVWLDGDAPEAAVLMSAPENGVMSNLWTWLHPKAGNPVTLPCVLSATISAASKQYPDAMIQFTAVSPTSDALLKKLLSKWDTGRELRTYRLNLEAPEEAEPAPAPEPEPASRPPRSPEDQERKLADFHPHPMTCSMLGCQGCRYATENLMSCARYPDGKPGVVFYGTPCSDYEKA